MSNDRSYRLLEFSWHSILISNSNIKNYTKLVWSMSHYTKLVKPIFQTTQFSK